MMNEFTLTLNSPLTEEQWDTITDVDFEHTNDITFHTKHGKEVVFKKASAQPEQRWIPVTEKLPDKFGRVLVTLVPDAGTLWIEVIIARYSDLMGIAKPCFWVGNVGKNDFENISKQVIAWMPLPEAYREEG